MLDAFCSACENESRETSVSLPGVKRRQRVAADDEINRAGGLTFNASSLLAKALHPDAPPSEEVRLEAFKAFSAWKSDSDVAKRR